MPDEELTEFFADMAGKSKSEVAARSKAIVSKYTVEEEWYEEGGQFLPLSVWANKGFDTEAISQKSAASDRKVHSVLGQCYRVKLLSTGVRGFEGTRNARDHTGRSKKAKTISASSTAAAAEIADAKDEEEQNEDSASDASSSSSSSSSDKKRKKKKKSKKSKKKDKKGNEKQKKREKEKQLQEKQDAKLLKARVALKSRLEAKLTPALQALVDKMAVPRASQLPEFLNQQVRAVMLKLQEMLDESAAASKDIKKLMPDTQDLGLSSQGQPRMAQDKPRTTHEKPCAPVLLGPPAGGPRRTQEEPGDSGGTRAPRRTKETHPQGCNEACQRGQEAVRLCHPNAAGDG